MEQYSFSKIQQGTKLLVFIPGEKRYIRMYFFCTTESYMIKGKDYFSCIFCSRNKNSITRVKDLNTLRQYQNSLLTKPDDYNYYEKNFVGYVPNQLKFVKIYKRGLLRRLKNNIRWFNKRSYFTWIKETKIDNSSLDGKNKYIYVELFLSKPFYKMKYFFNWLFYRFKRFALSFTFFLMLYRDSFIMPKILFREWKLLVLQYRNTSKGLFSTITDNEHKELKNSIEDARKKYIESISKTTSLAISILAICITLFISIQNSVNAKKSYNTLFEKYNITKYQVESLIKESENTDKVIIQLKDELKKINSINLDYTNRLFQLENEMHSVKK